MRAEGDESQVIDPRLQDVVERMFQRCSDDGEYEQAIGIALEARRIDVIENMIERGSPEKLLPYVQDVCMTLVQNLEFRNQVYIIIILEYVLNFGRYLSPNRFLDYLSAYIGNWMSQITFL